MKIFLALVLVIALFSGCEKDSDSSPCAREMRSFFEDDLECDTGGDLEYAVHLHKGEYNGVTVYFTHISCPSCGVIPPSHGYTCEKEKIEFDDFREVKNNTPVFDSCSKQYLE